MLFLLDIASALCLRNVDLGLVGSTLMSLLTQARQVMRPWRICELTHIGVVDVKTKVVELDLDSLLNVGLEGGPV